MRKLYYMGLESYEARYTLQLTEWNQRVFERRGLDVVYVPGQVLDNSQKIYLILSSAFYLFSIYQNILICIRFYSNIQKIHNYLFKFIIIGETGIYKAIIYKMLENHVFYCNSVMAVSVPSMTQL